MAQFRMLADHYINGQILSVGSIQTTADVGGLLPAGWIPTGDSEPLDAAALTLFYAAGVQFPSAAIPAQRAEDIYAVKLPTTYWQQIPGSTAFRLTGLGSNLPPLSL